LAHLFLLHALFFSSKLCPPMHSTLPHGLLCDLALSAFGLSFPWPDPPDDVRSIPPSYTASENRLLIHDFFSVLPNCTATPFYPHQIGSVLTYFRPFFFFSSETHQDKLLWIEDVPDLHGGRPSEGNSIRAHLDKFSLQRDLVTCAGLHLFHSGLTSPRRTPHRTALPLFKPVYWEGSE